MLSDEEVLEMLTGPGVDDQLECVMHHLPEHIRKGRLLYNSKSKLEHCF